MIPTQQIDYLESDTNEKFKKTKTQNKNKINV